MPMLPHLSVLLLTPCCLPVLPDPLAPSQPGPGAYEVDHASATTHATAPAYSISHRWVPDKEAERRPPPGEYDPDYR